MVRSVGTFHNSNSSSSLPNPKDGIDVVQSETKGGVQATMYVDMNAVLRPFESKLFQTTRGRQQKEEAEPEEAVFTLEATAKIQVTTMEGMGWSVSFPEPDDDNPDEDNAEEKRSVRTVRIYNPEDSEQYVDVEVIDSIDFKDVRNRLSRYTLKNT